MEQYFSVAEMKIPIELKPLYQEVSNLFEKKVMDAITNKKENDDEKIKKIFKESNYSRRLY